MATNAAVSPKRHCSYCGCPDDICASDDRPSTAHPQLANGVVGLLGHSTVTLLQCSGCLVAFYCCKEHQRLDWEFGHKPACRRIQQKRQMTHGQHQQYTLETPGAHDDALQPSAQPSHSRRDLLLDAPGGSQYFSGFRVRTGPNILPERRGTYGLGELAGLLQNQHRKISPASSLAHCSTKRSSATSSFDSLLCKVRLRPLDRARHILYGPEHFAMKLDHSVNQRFNLATDSWFKPPMHNVANDNFQLQRIQRIAYCVSISLKRFGWVILDNFLGPVHCQKVVNDVHTVYDTPGTFTDGRLVKTQSGSHAWNIRSDKIHWFDDKAEDGSVSISLLLSLIDSVMSRLQGISCSINGRSKAMIACYPGEGTRYVKHVDNPDKDGRCITSIYYLNNQWTNELGGILRLYPETALESVDIEPIADRLIFFWSDKRNPHEVLPSYALRYAITIWYFDKAEREAAKVRRTALLNEQTQDHSNDRQEHQVVEFLMQNYTVENISCSKGGTTSSDDKPSSSTSPSSAVTSRSVHDGSMKNGFVDDPSPSTSHGPIVADDRGCESSREGAALVTSFYADK